MTLWRLRHKLKSYVTFGQVFGLISSYFIGWLRVVLDEKSLQGYPVNTGVPEGFMLGPKFFFIYINGIPIMLPPILIFTCR